MLGVVVSVLADVVWNWMQQCWDMQFIEGRMQPIRLYCVMLMQGPYNVGRAVQMDPTLLRITSVISWQNKRNVGSCWLKNLTAVSNLTLRNNCQQHATTCQLHVTSNNVGSCWPTVLNLFAQALHRKIRFCLSLDSYLALYLSIWACGTKSIKSRPSLILRSISYFSRPLTYSKRNIRNITATKHLHIKLCPRNEIH